MLYIFVLTVFLCFFPVMGDNPFVDQSTETQQSSDAPSQSSESEEEVLVFAEEDPRNTEQSLPFWYGYVQWQRQVNDRLSEAMMELRENPSFFNIALIFIISLVYSFFHTAGPGHGKAIMAAYFLSSEKRHSSIDAAKAGVIVSMTHIGIAFLLSLIFYMVLRSVTAGAQSDEMGKFARFYGGIAVIITGSLIILSCIPKIKRILQNIEHQLPHSLQSNGSLVWFSILSGMIPCPLAWFVLIFSISYGIYGYGILSIAAMALGAAMTISLTSFVMITGKNKAADLFSLSRVQSLSAIVRSGGGILLIFLGTGMTLV
ncbi:MAG: nickel/cobalt transporter [Fibrobacterota bacterium]